MRFSKNLERTTKRKVSTETWTDEQFLEAREADLRERTASVWSVVVAALASLMLAAMLTTAKLVEIAERQPLGPWRDRQLAVADGVDRLANFLSLNRPYDLIVDIRGVGESPGQAIDTIAEVSPTTVPVPVATTSTPVAIPDVTLATTTTTLARFPLRTVEAASPLRVFAAGDSQMEFLSQALAADGGDRSIDINSEFRISTGLSRPDYFNWPAELASVISDSDPEAVVLFLGANDHQDMADANGDRLVRDTPPWQAEWSRRLGITFDLLKAPGRQVFWVTQPPMRDRKLDTAMRLLNDLAAPVTGARDFVTVIDIWGMFGGADGFASRVAGPDGSVVAARVNDGVHLNRRAASWVADLLFDAFDRTWQFAG